MVLRSSNPTHLKEVRSKQACRVFQVPRVVYLLEVVLLAPWSVPDLHKQRPGEVEELVLVEVGGDVGLVGVEILVGNPVWSQMLHSLRLSPTGTVAITYTHHH